MNETNNGLGIGDNENKSKQTFGAVQPKKRGSARKKVATAVVATAMVVAAIAVPTVIKLNQNKGYTVTIQYGIHGQLGSNTSINLKKGSVVGDIEVPAKPGYVFVRYCSDAECTKNLPAETEITEDLTVYLHYVAINYTFKSLPEGVSVSYENNAVTPGEYEEDSTTKLGYGAVLTVRYELPAGYRVTVDENNTQGLERVGEIETSTDAQGNTTYTVQYRVVGSGAEETEEEKLSISYGYEINRYTLTFVSDGEVFTTATRTYGEYVDRDPIASPSKASTVSSNYTFVGWSTDEDADPDDEYAMVNLATTQVTANTTYYAIYRESAREYNLTLNDAVPPECVIISMNKGGIWTDIGHPVDQYKNNVGYI